MHRSDVVNATIFYHEDDDVFSITKMMMLIFSINVMLFNVSGLSSSKNNLLEGTPFSGFFQL